MRGLAIPLPELLNLREEHHAIEALYVGAGVVRSTHDATGCGDEIAQIGPVGGGKVGLVLEP
jgi:hypothetical protein